VLASQTEGARGVAGLWSLIKRSPKAKIVRKVFEVPGPAVEGAMPLDARARQIYAYFKNYNYELKETGDVIRFVGTYQASKGQAAALVFYVFCGGTPLCPCVLCSLWWRPTLPLSSVSSVLGTHSALVFYVFCGGTPLQDSI
jgi:Cofactor assembly of complex C subunit B